MIHTFLNLSVEGPVKSFLKLIISFLLLHIVLLSLFKSLILVASTRHVALNLKCILEVGQQAHNFKILLNKNNPQAQEQPSSVGDRHCLSSSQGRVLVARVSDRRI
jgi:hypothetical protein